MSETRMETVDGARARIRGRALSEVRRRGRQRLAMRGSAIAMLAVAVAGVGLAGLGGGGRGEGASGAQSSDTLASNGGPELARVRWVQTDWSIGERTAARGAGRVRWVSDGDVGSPEPAGS